MITAPTSRRTKRCHTPLTVLIVAAALPHALASESAAQFITEYATPSYVGGTTTAAATPSAAAAIHFGGVLGSVYSPTEVAITVGGSVEWQGDFSSHPLVSDDAFWPTHSTGTAFVFTFTSTGTYLFHCQIHGGPNGIGMSGEVIVLPEKTPTPTSSPISTVTWTPTDTAAQTVTAASTLTPTTTSTTTNTPTVTTAATNTPTVTPTANQMPTVAPTVTVTPSPTNTTTATPTQTPTDAPAATPTLSPTSTQTSTPTETATPTPPPCVGDCDGSGDVTVDELITMVNIALGTAQLSTCPVGDANGDGDITVNEIIQAVGYALSGCVQNP